MGRIPLGSVVAREVELRLRVSAVKRPSPGFVGLAENAEARRHGRVGAAVRGSPHAEELGARNGEVTADASLQAESVLARPNC
eukprot:1026579-Pyramimonas_sp.AAC.1